MGGKEAFFIHYTVQEHRVLIPMVSLWKIQGYLLNEP